MSGLAQSHFVVPISLLPRLLAVHSAMVQILHLSGAGCHIDKILEDLDRNDVIADGSTELGYLATLRVMGSDQRSIYIEKRGIFKRRR